VLLASERDTIKCRKGKYDTYGYI